MKNNIYEKKFFTTSKGIIYLYGKENERERAEPLTSGFVAMQCSLHQFP